MISLLLYFLLLLCFFASSLCRHLYKTRDVDLKRAKNDVDDAKARRNTAKPRRDELKRRLDAHRPPVQSISGPPSAPETAFENLVGCPACPGTPQAGQTGSQHEHLDPPCRAARSNKRIKKKSAARQRGRWKRSGFAGASSQDGYRKVIGQTGAGLCSLSAGPTATNEQVSARRPRSR